MTPYLAFEQVTKEFDTPGGKLQVIAPFSLDIARNEVVVFLGPSGCGKTTLMRMVGGLDEPSSGAILLDGVPVGGPDRRRGMVFQSYSSFPWLTVAGNVAFGMRYRDDLSKPEKHERVGHYLSLVGPCRIRRCLSQSHLGRHAPARGDRAHFGGRIGDPADG